MQIGGQTLTATADANGDWSVTPATLPDGTYTPVISVTNPTGNTTANQNGTPFTIDASAPGTPLLTQVIDDFGSQQGNLSSGNSTNDNTPRLVGTAEAGSSVKIYDGNTLLATVPVDGNGDWSWTASPALADGSYSLTLTATDAAGNASPATSPFLLRVDTAAPAATGGLAPISDNNNDGLANPADSDNVTADNTPVIRGVTDAGATVTVQVGGQTLQATADQNGNWSITPTALADGTYTPVISVTDPAGNTTASQNGTQFTVDATAPSAPAAGILPADISGSTSDTLTSDTTPRLSGIGEPGSTITIKDQGGNTLATAVVDGNGNWQTQPLAQLPDGTHNLTVTATDPAGNQSPATPLALVIDSTPPPTPGTLAIPENAGGGVNAAEVTSGGGVPVTVPLTIGGANPVQAGDVIRLTVDDPTNNTPVVIAYTVTANDITNGSATVLVPTADIPVDGLYNLTATITDAAGNASAASTGSFTVDKTLPGTGTGSLSSASDNNNDGATNAADSDNLTADNTPVLSGTAEPGCTVEVTVGGKTYLINPAAAQQPAGITYTSGTGAWSIDLGAAIPVGEASPATPLADGSYTPTIRVTDAAGNATTSTGTAFTVDASVPGLAGDLATASDTSGTLAGSAVGNNTDNITSDTTPAFTGTGEAGNVITLTLANGTYKTTVQGNGTWTIDTGNVTAGVFVAGNANTYATFSSGTHLDLGLTSANAFTDNARPFDVGVTAMDAAGNTASVIIPVRIDTIVTDPTINITNGISPVTGTGEAGASVVLYESDVLARGDKTSTGATAEVQTFRSVSSMLVASQAVTLSVGSTSLTTATLDADPTLAELVTALQGASGYGTAPFTVAASGNDLVLTWKSAGVVNTTATLSGLSSTQTAAETTIGAGGITVDLNNGTWTAIVDPLANGHTFTTSKPRDYVVTGQVAGSGPNAGKVIVSGTITSAGISELNSGGSFTLYDSVQIGNVVTVAANGSWSVTFANPLANGTFLTANSVDLAGNIDPPGVAIVQTDNSIPLINPTNGALLTGTGKPGNLVALTVNGQPVLGANNQPLVVQVAPNGTWSATPGTPLAHNTVVTATDTVTNGSSNATVDAVAPAKPTLDLVAASDTGASSTDNLTSDTTPTLSGTGEPGSTIKIYDGVTLVGTAIVDGSGGWSATLSTALTDGPHTLTVTATDAAGNASVPSDPLAINIDTQAPAAPSSAPDMTAATDTGSSNTDNTTANPKPAFNIGALPAGSSSAVLLVNGTVIPATVTTDGNGNTILTPAAALPDGTHAISYALLDAAGNQSGPSPALSVTVDTTAPSQPLAPDLVAASDTGTSQTDNLTSDTTPTFSVPTGQGNVILLVNGAAVAATYDPNTGALTPSVPLPEGTHAIAIQVVDVAGNMSVPSAPLSVTIDATPPATPTTAPDMTAATDSGSSVTDNITNDTTPDFNLGTLPAGTSAVLLVNGQAVPANVTTDGTGNTILTPSTPLADGNHAISYALVDAAGNQSAPSPALNVTIDATPPATPAAPDLIAASDTGTSSTDNRTSDTTPTFTVPAGQGNVILLVNGSPVAATYDPATGTLTPNTPLVDFTYNFAVQTVDAAGNISVASTPLSVTIDTTAPTTPTVSALTTRADSITLTGTATLGAGETLSVTVNGATYDNVAVMNGAWSLKIAGSGAVTPSSGSLAAFPDGTYAVTATARDAAGNSSTDATSGELIVSSTAVTLGITGIASTSDTGASATDRITSDNTPTITGTSDQPNRLVMVTLNDGSTDYTFTTTTDGSGNWSLTTGTLPDGSYTVRASITSPAGGTGTATLSGAPLVVDTFAPTVVFTTVFGDNVSTASSNATFDITERGFNSVNYTLNPSVSPLPTINGTSTGADGRSVTVGLNGQTYQATVQAGGAWSVTVPDLDARALNHGATYTLTATLSDTAGNAATPDTDNGLVVNIAPPDVPTVVSQTTGSTTPTITGSAEKKVVSTATETTPGAAGTAEVQTITNIANALGANRAVTLTVGGTTLTTAALDATPTVAELAAALAAASGYGAAAFTVAASGNDLVLTWTTDGVVNDTASLTSFRSLEAGDALLVAIKDSTRTTTLGSYALTVGGSSTPAGLTYTAATSSWSLAVAAGDGLQAGNSYQVDVSATASGVTRSDISSLELRVTAPPVITSIPEVASGNLLNLTEANSTDSGQTAGGTVVNVSIAGSGAAAGQVLTLTWGGQTVSHVLTAAEVAANTVAVLVPSSTLIAETPLNTQETIAVSASLGSATSANVNAAINFTTPQAPVISATAPASFANPTSTLSGIPEALENARFTSAAAGITQAQAGQTGNDDNALYHSEVNNAADAGTWVRVHIPITGATGVTAATAALAGDSVVINWGTQTSAVTRAITSTDITTKFVDVLVPWSVIGTQSWGTVSVSAQIVNAAGNASAASAVNVNYVFDLPLVSTGANYGFRIDGRTAGEGTYVPAAQDRVGDVNGDGYDDFAITGVSVAGSPGFTYVVFGRPGLSSVELSDVGVAANSGFRISGVTNTAGSPLAAYVTGNGDLNGDGLADLAFTSPSADTGRYVIWGKTSGATVTISNNTTIAASDGLRIAVSGPSTWAGSPLSFLGDVNGDGVDDLGLTVSASNMSNYVVLYGSRTGSVATIPWLASGGSFVGGHQIQAWGVGGSYGGQFGPGGFGGDINGDGYADVVTRTENWNSTGGTVDVFFGGRNLPAAETAIWNTGNGLGYRITDFNVRVDRDVAGIQDVNGDGRDDILINWTASGGPAQTYVIFGKTSDVSFSRTELTTGTSTNGFVINGGYGRSAGDFNGDGLADIIVQDSSLTINGVATGGAYVVYGKTSGSAVTLSALRASDGYRINGISATDQAGFAVAPAGDVDGDGFADVLVSANQADPTGRTNGGTSYLIYGGVSELNPMVFQASNGDIIGTSGAETLTGTSGANQLIGGDGNDVLIGNGGADVLYGGRGNDVFLLNADNIVQLGRTVGNTSQAIMRVDGGAGMDTLRLIEPSLNLMQLPDAAIRSIERIDLDGSGRELRLNALEVINITGQDNIYNTTTGFTAVTAVGWGALQRGNQLLVDGDATNRLHMPGSWSNLGTVQNTTGGVTRIYKVLQSGSAAAQVLVDDRVALSLPPTLMTDANELAGGLSLSEAQDGTPMRVSLVDTGALAGNVIRLTYNGVNYDVTLSAGQISAGFVDIPVPFSALTAAMPVGTSGTVPATVALLNGGTVLNTSDPTPVASNFITPQAPIISATAWSSSGTSSLSGIPEALKNARYTGFAATTAVGAGDDNTLYLSEVDNSLDSGTWMRVQIPTAGTAGATAPALAGDSVVINWGSQTNAVTRVITSTDITNKFVDVLVPWSVIGTQSWGTVSVSARVVSASGNASAASTVDVSYVFDLPLISTGTTYGFRINGRSAAEETFTPTTQDEVGDVNGDGYDDFAISGKLGTYVVFGRPGLSTIELSDVGTAPNSGFRISGISSSSYPSSYHVNGNGDLNGDGLADLIIGVPWPNDTFHFVVYGKTSTAQVSVTNNTIAASDGFKLTAVGAQFYGGAVPSILGDVNGDGIDDLGMTIPNFSGYSVVYGSTSFGANVSVPFVASGGTFAGGYSIFANGMSPSFFPNGGIGGDINGDGFSDVVVRQEQSGGRWLNVFFGGTAFPGNESGLDVTGNGRGYRIRDTFASASVGGEIAGIEDVNGDGRGDIILNLAPTGVNQTYIFFGKTSDVSFSATELTSGTSTNGFIINGGFGRKAGDFNGDGLDDIVVQDVSPGATINGVATGASYLIYGKTSGSVVNLSALKASEGFRINGASADDRAGGHVAPAGDVDGDGFADLLVNAKQGDPTGRTNGGISYLVYGGVSEIRSLVFNGADGDAVGTSNNDTLTGTSGNNQIVAGAGNDTLRGLGGYDVLYGGAGNDRFEINDGNIRALAVASAGLAPVPSRIDGGTGLDTLVVGTGSFLSLRDVASRLYAIEAIERIAVEGGTLQIENGQALTVNEITGPFNRFNTGNGWTVTGTVAGFDASVDYHQLLIDSSGSSLLRLGSDFVKASGSLAYAGGSLGSAGNFDVYANAATRTQLIVRQGLTVQTTVSAPTISAIPEADASRSFGALTLAEANDLSSGVFVASPAGTPVLVSLAGTGAVAGQIVRLVWDEQAPVDYTLTSADISAGQARVTVPSATLNAATATGSIETVPVTAQILSGSTAITPLGISSALVDFTTASAPANAPVINTSNAAGSDLAGIAEAKFANGGTSVIDNILYQSEAVNGTVVQVFLKSAAAAGDWVRINWGNVAFTQKLASAVSVGGSVSVTVPFSVIAEQGYGTFNVTAQQFTADGVAGTAASAAVSVTYRFDLPLALPGSSTPSYGFSLFGETTSDKLGNAVSNAGDINGDGYEDLLIGASNVSPSQTGRAYLVWGGASSGTGSIGDTVTAGTGFRVTSQSSSQSLGDSVSTAGDLNGDGLADLLVGASNADMSTGTDAGATYTVYGRAATTEVMASAVAAGTGGFLIRGGTGSDNAGFAVSEIGDLNADGLADVLVVAQYADPAVGGTTLTNAGRAYIVYGKTGTSVVNLSNLAASEGLVINGFTSNDALNAGSAAGDVNGDGLPDFLLGSALADPSSRADAGRAYVVFGSTSSAAINLSAVNAGTGGFVVHGACASDRLGASVSQAGDVNGDGLADLVIGAPGASLPSGVGSGAGRVYVVFGRTSSSALEASAIAGGTGGFVINAESNSASSSMGISVSNAGDVNGDGLADLLIGSSLSDTAGADAGNAYVVYGKTSNTAVEVTALDVASSGFRIVGQSAGDNAGAAVSAAGDINGDGFADLVIGALNGDQTLTDRGKVYVIYGGMSDATATVFQSANGDAIGTSGADSLVGTSGDNQLVGGDGNDSLVGNGGADVLYGGRGNDQIVLNADNLLKLARNSGNDAQAVARIDGGTGVDTLDVNGDGLLFDLTAISNLAVTGIERIDITSSTTGNEVKLSRRDLLALAGTDNSFNSATGWAVASSNGATGWGSTNLGSQLVVDGSSQDTLTITNSYRDIGNVTQGGNTYRVFQSGTGLSQVIVDADMNVRVPPTLISTSEFEWADGLIQSEARSGGGTVLRVSIKDTGAVAGNAVRINWGAQNVVSSALSSTDLSNGYIEILVPTATLTAVTPDGSSGTVAVSADLLTAPTGGTLVSASDALQVAVNLTSANAPIISAAAWASGGASSTTGIPEALYATEWSTGTLPTSGLPDNTLFKSETSNGTIVRVQLPTSGVTGVTVPAVAGDTVRLNWGSQVINSAALTSTDITNKYIDFTVPAATLTAQGYGSTAVTAQVISAGTGNASSPSGTVTVNFAFDLSLALPGNQTAPSYGFSINGNTNPNSSTGGGAYAGVVSKLGDINGDGYEDVLIGAPLDALAAYATNGGAAYVVYGGTRMATVELSAMQSAGTSNGFKINAAGDTASRTSYFGLVGELDFNGDGLPDYLMPANYGGNTRNGRVFLVYGNSTGQNVQLSALDSGANSALGFRVDQQTGVTYGGIAYNVGTGPTGSGGNSGVTDIGDVNGDGLEDIAIGQSLASTGSATDSEPGRVVVLFGSTTARSNLVLPVFSSLSLAGGFILQGDSRMGPMLGSTVAGDGDINGDGYSDLLVTTSNTAASPAGAGASPVGTGYVLYGANSLASLNVTEFSAAGFSKGFVVSNIGQTANSIPTVASKMDFVGDVNGDGLDDIVVPGVTEAKVIFGRAAGGNVDAAQIGAAGNTQGFAISGLSGATTHNIYTRVAGIGDFNGDGLDDMIATAYEGPISGFTNTRIGHVWVVYGQTGNATVNVGNLQPSQGFWVKPFLLDSYITGIDAAGDVNGDGFADLIIGSGEDTVAGRTAKSGKSFIIFGGLSDMQSMTFQAANGDVIGTSAAESLIGTAGANQIVAGDGNDTVTGNGGADVMYGGRGNDTFLLNADNLAELALSIGNASQDIARINGGTGIDALQLAGAGIDFDLSQVRRSALEGIERINITGSGDNTLRLRLIDVLNFGDNNIWNAGNTNGVSGEALAAIEPRRQLRLEGNAGDTVDLSDFANWTRASNEMVDGSNFAVWNHNSALAQLLISPALAVI